MPLVRNSKYQAPFYLFSGHLETIIPALFRNTGRIDYHRERILTNDDDFLDLDWSIIGADKLAIISHGLEGDSHRPYVKGMVKAINMEGWDALAWNFRGCSGEMNKLCPFYHSGKSEDLDWVVQHAARVGYKKIVLIGFSIGGNITLKYLGEQKDRVTSAVKAAVTFSVPCHLQAGAYHLTQSFNRIYLNRFLKSLKFKIISKEAVLPGSYDLTGIDKISNFQEFDDRYTAPVNGFKNAIHYWTESSSIYQLPTIQIPTLLVNSQNDPFLPLECFPVEQAKNNPYLFLEMPETGGHVGFFNSFTSDMYWSEERAIEFINKYA
jgi:predicted alpha/beta-fold hydrolase